MKWLPRWTTLCLVLRRCSGRLAAVLAMCCLLVSCFLLNASSAQPAATSVAKPIESAEPSLYELNLRSFDLAWERVNETAWSPEFDAAGWAEQRDKHRPKITAESTREEVRGYINSMLAWLGQSHFGVIPAELYEQWDTPTDADGHAGFFVRMVDGQATVTEVLSGMGADVRGVEKGWRLVKLRDKPVSELIEFLRSATAKPDEHELLFQAAYMVDAQLKGPVGDELSVTLEDGDGGEHHLSIPLQRMPGEAVEIANLPRTVVRQELKEVAPGIAYFSFSNFFAPAQIFREWGKAVDRASAGRGLILDLRGNGGGIAGMTMGIANRLASEKDQYLGTLSTKETALKFVMIPSARPFTGPVAVLVDECSASASEFLAGGLQAVGRARVFGNTTAGAALPSIVEPLPNGDRLQYAFASYTDFRDRKIEGEGVVPDEKVPLTRTDLLAGTDRALQQAIQWIDRQTAGENADLP